MEEFVKKVIVRTIGNLKRTFFFIKTLPIIIDSSISNCIFHLKKRNFISASKPPVCHELYKKQFVAHGRYDLPYPNNSLKLFQEVFKRGFGIIECDVMFTKDNVPVLCHDDCILEFAKDKNGRPVDKKISKMTCEELEDYNFSIDDKEFVRITRFEDVIVLARSYNACVEIDLEKLYLGRRRYKILYEIVKRHDMMSNVIWEVLPHDFYSILLIDRSVILQLNHTWNENAILKFKKYQQDAALIILSEWFPGYVLKDYKEIIKTGHQNGYIMKCATLNSMAEAQKMISIGVDLITTDTLTNNQFEKLK